MPTQTLILHDDAMLGHDPGPGHPERPDRLRAVMGALDLNPIAAVRRAKVASATRDQIQRVHRPEYIDRIDSLRGKHAQLDPDTAVSPASVESAYLAAGAAIQAVTALIERAAQGVFALVRPPGHHAEQNRAMGFCLFNNIAIAAAHAIAEHDLKRVLVVDWDVHHGNGTQHSFYDRADVLFCSSHQHRLFPNTGEIDEIGRGQGEGFTVNAPLPQGLDDAAYWSLYQRLLVPIADSFKPQLVLVSAGFDAHRDDPLGGMMLTENGFAALCGLVRDIADRHADGRMGLILEGGYNLNALANSVTACVRVLAGQAPPEIAKVADPSSHHIIDGLCDFHARHWPCVHRDARRRNHAR